MAGVRNGVKSCARARALWSALALAWSGCAVGAPAAPGETEGAAAQAQAPAAVQPAPGAGVPSASGAAGTGGVQAHADAGAARAPSDGTMPGGEPCARDEQVACPCEAGEAEGQRVCTFDASSPLDGFLGACEGCPEPPSHGCDDQAKNGFETGTDCGGTECEPCPLGAGCVRDDDCEQGGCDRGVCAEPDPMPEPPAAGNGGGGAGGNGASGTTGAAGLPAPGGVADCVGQPDGTPCTTPLVACLGSAPPTCSLSLCLCLL